MTLNKSLFKKHLCVIFIIAIILSAASAYAATIRTVTGTVTKVSDGDTIHVKTPEQTKLTVRLYGVDAPRRLKSISALVVSTNLGNSDFQLPGRQEGDGFRGHKTENS